MNFEMEAIMAVLQVRSMDDEMYRALGRRAAMDNRSISQEVICIIERFLATPADQSPSTDEEALRLAGSWEDSHSAEEMAASIRKARSTDRFRGGF
jgi:plasmid stability protein